MIFWILFLMVGTAVTGFLALSDASPAPGGGTLAYALFGFVLLFTGSIVAVAMHVTRRNIR